MSDNLELWNSVSKTDPDNTKDVALGARRFTSIAPYSQIKAATEKFGPIGQGWGVTIKSISVQANCVIAHIELWWSLQENTLKSTYDCVGACSMHMGKNDRLDDDAPKKAVTDGITKGLSWLGFNADVHEGRFDDSKYVEELRSEKDQERTQTSLQQFQGELRACKNLQEIEELQRFWTPTVHNWPSEITIRALEAVKQKREALSESG